MQNSYPVILSPDAPGYLVYVPDFNVNTEGNDLFEAMAMARDVIAMTGNCWEDIGKPIPAPSEISAIHPEDENAIVTLVDVDFAEYRRMNDMRCIKKNCTVPAWLAYQAEQAGLNFSALLQDALKKQLNLT